MKEALVIGGGIAGLATAGSLANLGVRVHLVEQSNILGGHAAEWACMATDECARCSACLVEEEVHKVLTHPNIEVLLGAQVTAMEGEVGQHSLSIGPRAQPQGESGQMSNAPDRLLKEDVNRQANCVVLATGFQVYDPTPDLLLGYGRHDQVFTILDLDRALRADDLHKVIPGELQDPKIGFIQCVGSRDRTNGHGYCSQYCCRATIRLVNRLLFLRPDLQPTIFYIDLQIMSKEFNSFYERLGDRARFIQGVPAEVSPGQTEGKLKVYAPSLEEHKTKEFEFDRIILATGMTPPAARKAQADLFGLNLDEFGFLSTDQEENGLFSVGACSGPTDIQGSRLQALAAASRAAAWLDLTGERAERTRSKTKVGLKGVESHVS